MKYFVEQTVTYQAVIEAESEEDALTKVSEDWELWDSSREVVRASNYEVQSAENEHPENLEHIAGCKECRRYAELAGMRFE